MPPANAAPGNVTIHEPAASLVGIVSATGYIRCIGGKRLHRHSPAMTAFTATSNLAYASRIGCVYTTTIDIYCADDNAYWPKEIEKTALACPIDAREQRWAAVCTAA